MSTPKYDARYLLMLLVEFGEPSLEEEWNRWYDDVHIPAMLSVPGFLTAFRYKEHEQPSRYLTVYEIESPEVCRSEACLAVSGWGDWKPHIASWWRAVYELVDDFADWRLHEVRE
jgi:hypothetical protein